MGWVEGVVTLVKGLAWPVVVLVSVLVLKRQIGKLIDRLIHFSGPAGVSADFRQEVQAAGELAAAIAPNAPEELNTGLNEDLTLDKLNRMTRANPVAGVLTAWQLVSRAISDLGDDHQFTVITERRAMRELRNLGVVSDEAMALFDRLSKIRGEIVHERPSITSYEAQEFVVAAWRLASELGRARNPGTDPGR